MLRRSFIHLPGVSPQKEKALWSEGLSDWRELRDVAADYFQDKKHGELLRALDLSERAYEKKDLLHFSQTLPRDELWRIVPEFKDEITYLDIETTGTGYPPKAKSTTITFYYQGEVIQEHDSARKKKLVLQMLREAKILTTFFGTGFDVPFLSREYGIPFRIPHVDLCFWLKRLGHKGGLKRVQKLFPEIPERLSLDIDGYDAVKLWRMHEKGFPGALETLLTYNAEDTVVLEQLLYIALNYEIERRPELGLKKFRLPKMPELKTKSSARVYAALRGALDAEAGEQISLFE